MDADIQDDSWLLVGLACGDGTVRCVAALKDLLESDDFLFSASGSFGLYERTNEEEAGRELLKKTKITSASATQK